MSAINIYIAEPFEGLRGCELCDSVTDADDVAYLFDNPGGAVSVVCDECVAGGNDKIRDRIDAHIEQVEAKLTRLRELRTSTFTFPADIASEQARYERDCRRYEAAGESVPTIEEWRRLRARVRTDEW